MVKHREENIRHSNEMLTKWRGAQAQFWSYTAALATLEIRLFTADHPGNLLLVCSPCVSIAGPVYWDKCELAVTDDPSQEGLFIIQDQHASVRVLCRQLYALESSGLPSQDHSYPDMVNLEGAR